MNPGDLIRRTVAGSMTPVGESVRHNVKVPVGDTAMFVARFTSGRGLLITSELVLYRDCLYDTHITFWERVIT